MRASFLLCFFFVFIQVTLGQTVSTPASVVSSGARFTDDLIFDSQGSLYGSDYAGNSVYKLNPQGLISLFVSGFSSPNGLAFDSQGNLFVCDNTGNKIYKVNTSGVISDSFATNNPSGIIKDLYSDTLYFTSYLGNDVKKLAPNGTITPWLNGGPLNGPVGLCYDAGGQLYLSNFNDRKIFQLYSDSLRFLARIPGTNNSYLGFISAAFGSLWATNFQNHKVYRVFTGYTDSVVLYAGSSAGFTNGSLDSAKFRQPNGILAKNDSLFISEYSTGRIRIISDIDADLGKTKNSLENKKAQVYPNPCYNYLRVSQSLLSDFSQYEIHNLAGQVLQMGSLKVSQNVRVDKLPTGFYILILVGQQPAESIPFKKL